MSSVYLEELSSLPENRCDPYNFTYISPFSNTVVVGVSNGVLFLRFRQEKASFTNGSDLIANVVSQADGTSSDIGVSSSERLFRTSLQITSAVEFDLPYQDPVAMFRPSFVSGLTDENAEMYYYDSFLAQQPASRQLGVPLTHNRCLCRTSGSHFTKISSSLICLSDSSLNFDPLENDMTGLEVVFALTSTGGWYAFHCRHQEAIQQPSWRLFYSWKMADAPYVAKHKQVTKPSDASQNLVDILHSKCTADLVSAESSNGKILMFVLDGTGQLYGHAINVLQLTSSLTASTASAVSTAFTTEKLDLTCLGAKPIKLCYFRRKKLSCLAVGLEDGRVVLLNDVTPKMPPSQTELSEFSRSTITFGGSQFLWLYEDVIPNSLSIFPVYYDYSSLFSKKSLNKYTAESVGGFFKNKLKVLVAAKGAFLVAWLVQDNYDAKEQPPPVAFCHIDSFPIISVTTSESDEDGKERDGNIYELARFVVCTQRGIYSAQLKMTASSLSSPPELQLTCFLLLAVDAMSSPLGKSGIEPSALKSSKSMATLLEHTFRKRHLSMQQWLFLGFAGSPSSKFFVTASGIFCPCRSSQLLSPSFSLKVFTLANSGDKTTADISKKLANWDNTMYELSSCFKKEADLIAFAESAAAVSDGDGGIDETGHCYYVLLQQACLAYTNGCMQITAPAQVVAARNTLKLAIFRKYVKLLVTSKLPLDRESQGNAAKYHGFLHDLAQICSGWQIVLPDYFSMLLQNLGTVAAFARLECPICKMVLTMMEQPVVERLTGQTAAVDSAAKEAVPSAAVSVEPPEGQSVLMYGCGNGHFYRPCSKSLLPFSTKEDSPLATMPFFCLSCYEPLLKLVDSSESRGNDNLIDKTLCSLVGSPCTFCGSVVLP